MLLWGHTPHRTFRYSSLLPPKRDLVFGAQGYGTLFNSNNKPYLNKPTLRHLYRRQSFLSAALFLLAFALAVVLCAAFSAEGGRRQKSGEIL